MSGGGKRRSALDNRQLGFTFEAPLMPSGASALAGLERRVAASVARALKEDARSREEIAGAVSSMLGEPVTKMMLDAYASEARDNHNVSAGRFMAVIAVTHRYDLFDALVREIGAALLVGEELHLARAGDLRSQIARAQRELKAIESRMRPIERDR